MINKVILLGRLTADPEVKQTTNGTPIVKFTIAVKRRLQKDKTDFLPIVAWNQNAEFIGKYFKKGDGICVVGELQSESYEVNGKSRTSLSVVCSEVSFSVGNAANGEAKQATNDFEDVKDNDLPF